MKLRIASIVFVIAALAAMPAFSQILVNNGSINGTTDGWTINFGFVVSDSFTLSQASSITGLSFGAWVFPGDTLQSAEVDITSSEFGGTNYYSSVVSFSQTGCVGNQYGFNVCTEQSSGMTPANLGAGSYWLNLSNAVTAAGNPIYWDENSGPASASENSVGTIPSEAFTLSGTSQGTGGTPEPSSILLLGSGVVGIAGILRRRLF